MQAWNCVELGVREDDGSFGIFFQSRNSANSEWQEQLSIKYLGDGDWPRRHIAFSLHWPSLIQVHSCINYFFTPVKSHLRKEGFILAHNSKGCSPSWQGRQAYQQGQRQLVILYLQSGNRDKRWHFACFFHFSQSRVPVHNMVPATVGVVLLTSLNLETLTDMPRDLSLRWV